MIAAGLPGHRSCAVLRDYPRNLLSTGRAIAGESVPIAVMTAAMAGALAPYEYNRLPMLTRSSTAYPSRS
jgi:hypothetical protein